MAHLPFAACSTRVLLCSYGKSPSPNAKKQIFFLEGGDVPESLIIKSTIIKASTIKA